ncbi:MAG: hypothetical protein AB7F31_03155 [Parachlamydiales bacterium]
MANTWPVRAAWLGYSGYCLYHLFESSLSHLLVVDTLRHGTGLKGCLGIHLFGADPDRGGKHGLVEETSVGLVNVWRDSRRPELDPAEVLQIKYVGPRSYSGLGLSHDVGLSKGFLDQHWYVALALSFLVPTVKVHQRPRDDSYQAYWHKTAVLDFHPWILNSPLEKEPADYEGYYQNTVHWPSALVTDQKIPFYKIGILGSLSQGINGGLPRRIAYHPSRFLLGAAQMALVIYSGSRLVGRPIDLPVPGLVVRAWEYRALRWPAEAFLRLAAW